MDRIKKLNWVIKHIISNYKIKILDFAYLDQVILHDAENHFYIELNNTELQYIKAGIKMMLYKKQIEMDESTKQKEQLYTYNAQKRG